MVDFPIVKSFLMTNDDYEYYHIRKCEKPENYYDPTKFLIFKENNVPYLNKTVCFGFTNGKNKDHKHMTFGTCDIILDLKDKEHISYISEVQKESFDVGRANYNNAMNSIGNYADVRE